MTAGSPLVVDSSVAAKWYLPEPDSALAEAVAAAHSLLAPDLLVTELGNILWKRVERSLMPQREAEEIVARFVEREPIRFYRAPVLIRAAVEIASTYHRSVYDSLYVALAVHEDTVMVTADARLVNALAGTPLARHVRLLSTF